MERHFTFLYWKTYYCDDGNIPQAIYTFGAIIIKISTSLFFFIENDKLILKLMQDCVG